MRNANCPVPQTSRQSLCLACLVDAVRSTHTFCKAKLAKTPCFPLYTSLALFLGELTRSLQLGTSISPGNTYIRSVKSPDSIVALNELCEDVKFRVMHAAGAALQHGTGRGVCAAQCGQPGEQQGPELHVLPGVHRGSPQGQAHSRLRPLQLRWGFGLSTKQASWHEVLRECWSCSSFYKWSIQFILLHFRDP